MPTPLPRSSPSAQDVDAHAVLGFLDAIAGHAGDAGLELHSLMVLRHGHVVAEGWWAPYTSQSRQLVYSLSKSVTATAAAFAQAEGLLDLDDTVLTHFPEWEDVAAPASRSIRLRHVLAMASGHGRDMVHEALMADPADPLRGFLSVAPDAEPGSRFAYSQPCTYAVASVIERRAGMPLTDYLRPRLFDPLGIDSVGWHTWPPGRQQGFSGLHLRTEDIAKLGQLHLQRGRWRGQQLIPERWVTQATSRQVDNPDGENVDWRQGYGYQFWMSRHGYRGDGAFGQFCLVLPEQDTVVAITAETERMQDVLDAVWTHLLPGLGATSTSAADEELANRLAAVTLPAYGVGTPAGWRAPPARERPAPGPTSFTGITSEHPEQRGWQLTLHQGGDARSLGVGVGGWEVSAPVDRRGAHAVPVAASGGPTGRGARAEVVFLETPHRLHITWDADAPTAAIEWRHVPLLGSTPFAELRCPT